jgi:Zn-dependent M16 (insulinase) family peptidase
MSRPKLSIYRPLDTAYLFLPHTGRCGYKSETGGLMSEIRQLTNATVRAYHQQYYRPDNLCLIVTGLVTEAALLGAG